MRKTRTRYGVRWALAAVCLAATAVCLAALTNGTSAAGSFTRACAARDMQILKMIDESEDADAISAQKSTDAILAMMHARMVCFEGRVLDALAIYDSVSQSMAPNSLLSDRRQ
jgi:hypothetical protein